MILKKVKRKAEEAAFALFEDTNGVIEEVRIPLSLYNGLSSHPEVHALRPDKTLRGGYTRYDYDTPTGLLSDGEYGDDGVDELGRPEYQVVIGGKYITIPKEKIISDKINLQDAEVSEELIKKSVDVSSLLATIEP